MRRNFVCRAFNRSGEHKKGGRTPEERGKRSLKKFGRSINGVWEKCGKREDEGACLLFWGWWWGEWLGRGFRRVIKLVT